MVNHVKIIQKTVAAYFGMTLKELERHTHERSIAWPRQIAMHFSRTKTATSLPELGRIFGNRHHTTVLWAARQTARRLRDDPGGQIAKWIEAIEPRIDTAIAADIAREGAKAVARTPNPVVTRALARYAQMTDSGVHSEVALARAAREAGLLCSTLREVIPAPAVEIA